MVLWNENMSVIMALDSQNLSPKLREKVQVLCYKVAERSAFCKQILNRGTS